MAAVTTAQQVRIRVNYAAAPAAAPTINYYLLTLNSPFPPKKITDFSKKFCQFKKS